MKTRSETFVIAGDTVWQDLGGGMRRQIMGYDGQMMMVKVEFQPLAVGVVHEHYHSQTTYVVSGRFEATIGDTTRELVAGDGFYTEPDQAHGVKCIEAGILIDVFTPHRADFLK